MLTSVSVKNFRCLTDLDIEPLDRVNLIAGTNNVGKTALLEAIFLLSGTENAFLIFKINALRGVVQLEFDTEAIIEHVWKPLFFNYDTDNPVVISGTLANGEKFKVEFDLVSEDSSAHIEIDNGELNLEANGFSNQVMQLRYTNPSGDTRPLRLSLLPNAAKEIQIKPKPVRPFFPSELMSTRQRPSLTQTAERFGRLQQEKRELDYLVKALTVIERDLDSLTSVFSAGVPMIYGDVGLDHLIPLPFMGEGIGHLASILLTISEARGGVVLIDEIENGFHYSKLPAVWQAIRQAARDFDTQVFATTHSLECAKAAHEVFESSDDYEFRYHRLDRIDGEIKVATSDQETMGTALGLNWEIR